jgi:hypothetical protein
VIARWNGSAWENPTAGASQRLVQLGDCTIRDMTVVPATGDAPASLLVAGYVGVIQGGRFTIGPAELLALSGGSWIGVPVPIYPGTRVTDVLVWMHAAEPELFIATGPEIFRQVAGAWTRIPFRAGGIWSLGEFDDGSGTYLYAGGSNIGTVDTGYVFSTARWTGTYWTLAGSLYELPVANVYEFLAGASPSTDSRWLVARGFQLTALRACASCPADFNRSGTADVDDVFSFLNAWFRVDPQADTDGRGGVTIDDLFAFLRSWSLGCP